MTEYDVAIIGGGVNGCGIARDAAGRGLSVFLAEKDDLASGTSSASTKLIHGGLRYLEHFEFGLVRESLREREVLWGIAPHIIRPLRFVLPYHPGLRPAWLIRLGLFIYDHLGGREALPATKTLNLAKDTAGQSLQAPFTKAFEYSDCWVDDARLVVLNARDAADRGADIRTRMEVVRAAKEADIWRIDLFDRETGVTSQVGARILVNATGPWIGDVLSEKIEPTSGKSNEKKIRLVKGSHIVLPRLFEHDRAYIFQNTDKRVVFAIPYEGDYTLVGTTDVDYLGRPEDVTADADEVSYLCEIVGEYFRKPVAPREVLWSYAGIRPLYDDGSPTAQEATRDYVLEVLGDPDGAALVNVFGGKITTYRTLAEEVLKKLSPWLPNARAPWTDKAPLPGGDFHKSGGTALLNELTDEHPGLGHALLSRYIRTYGTRTKEITAGAVRTADLGTDFGAGLFEKEVRYLIDNEWARSADDILWRRTKLGLKMDKCAAAGLAGWIKDRIGPDQSNQAEGG